MGLFDKIKDNAKNISIKAIEAPDGDYSLPEQSSAADPTPDEVVPAPQAVIEPSPQEETEQAIEAEEPEPVQEEKKETAPKSEPSPKPSEKAIEEKPKAKEADKTPVTPKPHQPYYKATLATPAVKTEEKPKPEQPKKQSTARPKTHVIDITPQKVQDPVKREIYARERAAMSALASQRKLNGVVPLYVTSHLNFKTRVFINRIEYSGSFGKNVLPIETVAWVKLRASGTGIIIETTAGKRVVMVVKPKDRLDFADAVMKVQEMQPKRTKFKDTKTVRIDQLEQFTDDYDELEKLARLREKGILTQEEFDTKKKKILGI